MKNYHFCLYKPCKAFRAGEKNRNWQDSRKIRICTVVALQTAFFIFDYWSATVAKDAFFRVACRQGMEHEREIGPRNSA